ncbi:Ig-like domain-containing protein [Humisphaera borealis]|uniref:Ig-like domain-containing protein n=1 Tax=Humisphaera borealis TaxID=2807512 RepID=A0A7M2WYM7_9BACT|nr:Ig-like domain-containing protein [Humisphaera borealis]QOV90565.1 Ig-like domain-containing protein [Humisphaera borealis]
MKDNKATSVHHPDYAQRGTQSCRRSSRWLRLGVVLLLLAVGVSAAVWAKGRGYKTAMLRVIFPESPVYLSKPTVVAVRPADMTGGVPPDAFIAADVRLPNKGKVIDRKTLENGVMLLKGNAREKVPALVNTSGGGDAIVLRPLKPLELNALYTFEVLPALKDTGGASFEQHSTTFSTAAGTVYSEFPAAAVKVEQPLSAGNWYTGLAFGPDERLYASTIAGQVVRFDVAADGSLSAPKVITTVLAANQGPRIMTGLTFDPAATRDNPIIYVAHGTFPFDRMPEGDNVRSKAGTPHGMSKKVIPDWSGKISRLSGPNLENYQDIVVGLPRARHDHTTGQISFGPDGAMYFAQASNTAMGEADHEWGYRPERLLTACVMRLDMKRLSSLPLNSQTAGAEVNYDPFADGAPLTIVATGTRNCYDLLFHSNGRFYATLNGSARGGNTPAGGPSDVRRFDQAAAGGYDGPTVPGLKEVGTQNDYLLRLESGGYYGHPNPLRAEFVMNGGNPTAAIDACEVAEYPVGVVPDRNYRFPSFDFGKNLSPCGMTEYRGQAFPALRGKVLVVRFSGGKDIIALTPGDDGDIRHFVTNLDGFTHFHDPVDLCVSPATGYIYVAEHTGRKITLLRPTEQNRSASAIQQDVIPPGRNGPASILPMVSTPRE